MKHSLSTLKITLASAMLALCMMPGIGWSTRLLRIRQRTGHQSVGGR